jgi:peptide/nickel transport system permease protein
MARFLLRRVLLMVPTFVGITAITFLVARWAPGDPFQLDVEVAGASAVAASQARAAHGLEAPLPVQYARWLGRVVRLDFGRSFVDQREVTQKLAEALPRTALVSGLALVLGFGVAVPLGVVLATRAKERWARLVVLGLTAGWAVPSFWLAVLLLLFFASPRFLQWFPVQGLEGLGVVLPVLSLAWPTLIIATRQVRGAMQEALAQEYVKAARARGLPEGIVVWKHALPNSMLPVVTLLGLHLPHLVGGSAVIERIFGVPGMGLLAFDAIGARDYPTVMGVTTVMALVTMVAMLLVDLVYGFIDPRLRVDR